MTMPFFLGASSLPFGGVDERREMFIYDGMIDIACVDEKTEAEYS